MAALGARGADGGPERETVVDLGVAEEQPGTVHALENVFAPTMRASLLPSYAGALREQSGGSDVAGSGGASIKKYDSVVVDGSHAIRCGYAGPGGSGEHCGDRLDPAGGAGIAPGCLDTAAPAVACTGWATARRP